MKNRSNDPACGCPGRVKAPMTRRELLKTSANGFGMLALSALMADPSYAGLVQKQGPHHAPKAKNVIFLFMDGGVSHVDSFDPKPKLTEMHGKAVGKVDNPTAGGARKWLKCPWEFKQYGQSGMPISSLFPHAATIADELAVIRSMKAEFPLHSRGNLLLHTGRNTGGLPSFGSWVTYGLGSENKNLPGFVVLNFNMVPAGGLENFSSGFLPATHQATMLNATGTPLDNLVPADKIARVQRMKLDLLGAQDQEFSRNLGGMEPVESAIENYELAYRMQSLVPDVLDLSKESEETKKSYGLDAENKHKREYGMQCLRARRLIESGVRFVEVCCPQLYGATGTWDQHGELKKGHETNAMVTDQAVTALIKDLKQRGMLDDTLILWAGEFGRTPHSAGDDGRDHHPEGFTVWLAGGGVKGGTIYGATDELGMHSVENVCTFHDLHATMLHLIGLDHERLTYRFGGRDFRLTDVHGRVIKEIIA
ncbi:MAG: DUF1501 domain-containing protein [Armatimonadota bacterium]